MSVSAQKQPSRREAQSKSVEDLLLHPKNLECANKLRAGKPLPPYPTKTTLTLNSTLQVASEVQNHLVAWLKSGDIEQLVQLIKEFPDAIALPEVSNQISHLGSLVRMTSEEDYVASKHRINPPPNQRDFLTWGVKPAAEAALQRLLTAWVQGVLPRYTVEPIKYTKRGARRKVDFFDELDLLGDFEMLLEKLERRHFHHFMDFKLKEGETRESLIERTAQMVQEINSGCPYSFDSLPPPNKPDADEWEWLVVTRPLPEDTARAIARQAIKKRDVAKNELIYGLLAYWHFQQHGALQRVRGIIERAEAEHPDLAPPRRSRKR